MDLISVIVSDHQLVISKWNHFKQTTLADEKWHLAHEIIKLLSIHSACEEELVYPLIKKTLPNGKELVERSLREHQATKDGLYKLEQFKLVDQDFIQTLNDTMNVS
jgi:hypothetical protein